MKKLFLLILILASNLFGQGWNQIVTTTIIDPVKTDIFTNSSGIHILIQTYGNDIVYYKLNSAGDVEKTVPLETSGSFPSFPNIIGSNDKIYAVYKTVNNNNIDVIRVKYSTDNGSSWIWNPNLDRLTSDKFCNGVDAVYEPNYGVHTVWGLRDSDPNFETYYYRLNTVHSWVEPKTVTDASEAPYGGNPSVTVSPNRVHVSFNTDATTNDYGIGDVKTRDKFNGNWQTPQPVVSGSEQSVDERLLVRGDYLYLFYNCFISGNPNDLRFRTRNVNTTGWSGFTTIESGTLFDFEDSFEITKTTNDYIHLIYKKFIQFQGWNYTYKYYDGTSWSTPYSFDDYAINGRQIGLSSVSNDLFCTWVKWETPTKYMRFRQYDAIPLAPTGLTITEDVNHHPRLNWNANPEPDIHHYIIERYDTYGGGWQYLNQTPNCTTYTYTDETLTYCHAVPPAQCPDVRTFYFRVKAVDLHSPPFSSPPSNQVGTRLQGGPPSKIVADPGSNESIVYSLSQNYPNPFNPTTTINYSIKTVGEVTLKVYDMLGTEVASLVNEVKEPGNYSVTFNAANLPSGMYVYILSTGNFIETKKLILLK